MDPGFSMGLLEPNLWPTQWLMTELILDVNEEIHRSQANNPFLWELKQNEIHIRGFKGERIENNA
jgi:hypothetical protein